MSSPDGRDAAPADPGRRRVLRAGALGAGAATLGAAGVGGAWALSTQRGGGPTAAAPGTPTATASADPAAPEAAAAPADTPLFGDQTVPFHGEHQAGIETAPQAAATLLGLDLRPGTDLAALRRLLRLLTDDAARLTQGEPALADVEPEMTREPARLTVTVGFGPGLMTAAGRTPPDWLAPLPAFQIDQLQPRYTGSDLLIQVAADDPLVVAHAARLLAKDARAFTTARFTQRGFRRARGTQPGGTTQRNLFGQLDGSANPQLGSEHFRRVVWIPDGPFAGGTSLVLRRIRMDLDTWDAVDRVARENAVGRHLDTGAPLGGRAEQDLPDFEALTPHGFARIPEFSHMRRARGVDESRHDEIFRRPYNYEETVGPEGELESGLLFLSFQADLRAQFLPIQQRLAELDLLNQWTTPVGSTVVAIPPGCQEGEYLGQSVLEG
ncbi:Dyp-type peroxidase [Brachybacterium sp. EF45031]|uniref:Dyp-type peroxidase n=1 Tax=Brachybacterium sillae TaxID=2810536 RepID=UPI00217E8E74|nr:Dyp-type peroxidase [Brachybacterium sillae]MCS6711895.1 Dyp-type peroxidase [Brachybacterium sillae]